ncbi:O-linked N-acetylglucosamine transferase, SPINDLY family protein [Candidatus Pelagibacter sp. HIMB1542]|uniref:O-linked N-acetylglucosamine transferase, SPINDLY family protein n=1 Tax=Candidatus Pelagibacter sp. HIMB1542 TaxID=3413346 RepID=UPI003F87B53D
MSDKIKEYKILFHEKKFQKIINDIESSDYQKTPQLLHILGISKSFLNSDKKNLISARENFRNAYLLDKNSSLGYEALSNFIKLSSRIFDVDDALKYYEENKSKFSNNLVILRAISDVYKYTLQVKKRLLILRRIIEIDPNANDIWCSYIYANNFIHEWTQEKFLNHSSHYYESLKRYKFEDLKIDNNILDRKIKLGFFSSDLFQGHSIMYFLSSLLNNFDKKKFEIIAISNSKNDSKSESVKHKFNHWINVASLSDESAVNLIRTKKIDIVFDLMGFTSESRLNLFKNRLAPIQISWLGYCNTTGVKEIDYLIADNNLILQNEESFYSEKIIRLNIWNAHVGFNFKKEKVEFPALKKGFVTFGSFNNFNKISDTNLSIWCKILKQNKTSRLILKSSKKYNTDFLMEVFEKESLKDRVEILDTSTDLTNHFKKYEYIDIALDTFPYNGVTTTFEALWNGVPVLTLRGNNFNSRCGSSILYNLGVNYLIAKDENEYLFKASDLSNNFNAIKELREKVNNKLLDSSLFNSKSFTNDFQNNIVKVIKENLV